MALVAIERLCTAAFHAMSEIHRVSPRTRMVALATYKNALSVFSARGAGARSCLSKKSTRSDWRWHEGAASSGPAVSSHGGGWRHALWPTNAARKSAIGYSILESHVDMGRAFLATLTLWMLGGFIFMLIVAFIAWQRGLGSTH
ncbi:MAG: hypothetical protein ACOC5M_01140 [Chloroflexota bacterium]